MRNELESRVRVLSSRDDNNEASFRVYYGASGATVPFVWESQPGTPKHRIFDTSNDEITPPLTPPPSYKSSSSSRKTISCRNSWSFSNFFSRSKLTPARSMSSSSSSSYYEHNRSWSISSANSSLSSPRQAGRKKNVYHKRSASSLCFSGHKSLLLEDDDEMGPGSPRSTMCFGFTSKKQGCYSLENVKNAILSI